MVAMLGTLFAVPLMYTGVLGLQERARGWRQLRSGDAPSPRASKLDPLSEDLS
jgi:hypothetical protein